MARSPLMPADTPDYMAGAWAACVDAACRNDDIARTFTEQTGIKPEADMEAFVTWINVNIWGPVGPT